MKNIRVLVVDDSFFMRKMITDLLSDSGVIDVIDTAKNGLEAIEKIKQHSPDVVTLDVEMPEMNGLEALKIIMNQYPLPVIMLSSLTKHGTDTTINALQFGAFDFVAKPSGAISFDIKKIKNELIDKILIAHSQSKRWTSQWNSGRSSKIEKRIIKAFPETDQELSGIVAIGTSTGGPKALQEVITNIPENFPYALLIVQHMPAGFTKSLADRLDSLSEITVVEAADKQIIKPGTAYIAPGNYHMTIEHNFNNFHISLNQEDPRAGHRPAVDVLFESLSESNLKKIFVIMTGMGSDGTKGLIKAKGKDDTIIAEDEKTCVVYGMPKSAIQSGLVDIVVPLNHISDNIINLVEKQRGWR